MVSRNYYCLLLLSFTLLGGLAHDAAAQSRLYVKPGAAGAQTGASWNDAFTTLQPAIDKAAVAYASSGQPCEVWVAAGRYKLSAPLSLKSGATIYGGFAGTETVLGARNHKKNLTVLDRAAAAAAAYAANGAVAVADGTKAWRLDGFTLTGGKASGNGGALVLKNGQGQLANCTLELNASNASGGAVHLYAGNYGFDQCLLRSNQAAGNGGAILAEGAGQCAFLNCTLANNTANIGGAVYGTGGYSLAFTRGELRGNVAVDRGGAASLGGSARAVFTGCRLSANQARQHEGGALECRADWYNERIALVLRDCSLTGNKAYAAATASFRSTSNDTGGGALFISGNTSATLANCLLTGNANCTLGEGGGAITARSVHATNPRLDVLGCLFQGNSVSVGRGAAIRIYTQGALNETGANRIANSIFSGNQGAEAIYWSGTGKLELANCLFYANPQGAYAKANGAAVPDAGVAALGTALSCADPRFVNAAAGDFHPRHDSPAVDAGANAAAAPFSTDLDGNPRLSDGDGDGKAVVEIGPYELVRPGVAWDLAEATLAHWPLDDNAASQVVRDGAGNYNGLWRGDGTTAGHSRPGRVGRALDFDGLADFAELGALSGSIFSKDFAWGGWFKADSAQLEKDSILTVLSAHEAATPQNGFDVRVVCDPALPTRGQLVISYALGAEKGSLIGLTAAADGQWHHFLLQRRGELLSLAFDGQQEDQVVLGRAAGFASPLKMILGGGAQPQDRFHGLLDDVRLFGRALSAAELAGLYAGGAGTADELNHAPYFLESPLWKGFIAAGRPWSGSLRADAADPDSGDTLSFLKVAGPAWLAVAPNGALSGTPAVANVGVNAWTVRVADNKGGSSRASLKLTVVKNQPPAFLSTPFSGAPAYVNIPYSGSLAQSVKDPDVREGDTLSFAKLSGPAWLVVGDDGTLSGTPVPADLGTVQFTLEVRDRTGAAARAVMKIAVQTTQRAASATSPAWVEDQVTTGSGRITVSVNGKPAFEAVRESASAWYADNASAAGLAPGVVLDPARPAVLTVKVGRPGQTTLSQTRSLAWTPTNLRGADAKKPILVRRGESLLLTANGRGRLLEIDGDGDGTYELRGAAGARFPVLFAKAAAGIKVSARLDGKVVGTARVTVVEANLDGPIACQVYWRRAKKVYVTPASAGTQVALVAADPRALAVTPNRSTASFTEVYLKAFNNVRTPLQARLGGPRGPLLAQLPVDGFTLINNSQNYINVYKTLSDGTQLAEAIFTMSPRVPGVDLQLSIFSGCATFEDSTLDKKISSSTFDSKGHYWLHMMSAGKKFSVCFTGFCSQRGEVLSRF